MSKYTNPINGQPSSSPGSPGVSGAIKDAVAALQRSLAPKALTQRGAKLNSQISGAEGGSEDTRINAGDTSP